MNQILIIDEAQPVSMEAWRRLKDHVTPANIIIHSTEGKNEMGSMNRSLVISALAAGLAGIQQPTFGASFAMLYGNNPKSLNGQSRCNSTVAKDKRAKAKRRNIAKNPRSAHKQGGHRWNKVQHA